MLRSRHKAAAAAAAATTTLPEEKSTSSTKESSTSKDTTSTKDTPTTKESSTEIRFQKVTLDSWTTREKLYLASLALKHNNSWNTVARHMLAFLEKDRPENWSNQKKCAAQFGKMMNELGVDKRPKRNEQADSSNSVIYKKMTEKRIKELEEDITELRKQWLQVSADLNATDEPSPSKELVKSEEAATGKQKTRQSAAAARATAKANTSVTSESEKLPTRALTRRESSRQNLEKIFAHLHQEASEIKAINQLSKPTLEVEKALGSYDKAILKHVDLATIKRTYVGEIEDPHALMTDLLLMFQNATMYYPTDHPVYQTAVELREKLLPQWEKQIIERYKPKA